MKSLSMPLAAAMLLYLAASPLGAESLLTPSQHSAIHNSNFRPTIRVQKRRSMHRLPKIDEKEARSIAEKVCQEPVRSIGLVHRHLYLFYEIRTKHCRLQINALDGNMTIKERK